MPKTMGMLWGLRMIIANILIYFNKKITKIYCSHISDFDGIVNKESRLSFSRKLIAVLKF